MLALALVCILPIFTCLLANNNNGLEDEEDDGTSLSFSDEKWDFLMLRTDKLTFDKSENLYGILREPELDKINLRNFYVVTKRNLPNVDIDFLLDRNDHSLVCHYTVFEDKFLLGILHWKGTNKEGKLIEAEKLKDAFQYQKEKTKKCNGPDDCTFGDDIKWAEVQMEGGGTFNEEVQDPTCIYEFYRIALERSEYELLRYCAKGYFYRGFDFNDYDRARFMRKDWVLYLMSGVLKCNVSGPSRDQAEINQELLGMGYQLDMVQKNPQPVAGCEKEQTLCEYKDDDKEGRFMMASILGSVRFGKECDANSQLVDELVYNVVSSRYLFHLRVGHYCTKEKEFQEINFDLSFDIRQMAHEGVQEDQDVEVLLEKGIIRFPTNFLLCADEVKADKCVESQKEVREALDISEPPAPTTPAPEPVLEPAPAKKRSSKLEAADANKQKQLSMAMDEATNFITTMSRGNGTENGTDGNGTDGNGTENGAERIFLGNNGTEQPELEEQGPILIYAICHAWLLANGKPYATACVLIKSEQNGKNTS